MSETTRGYVPNKLRGVMSSSSDGMNGQSTKSRFKGRKTRPWRVDAASWKQQLQERKAVYDHFAVPEGPDDDKQGIVVSSPSPALSSSSNDNKHTARDEQKESYDHAVEDQIEVVITSSPTTITTTTMTSKTTESQTRPSFKRPSVGEAPVALSPLSKSSKSPIISPIKTPSHTTNPHISPQISSSPSKSPHARSPIKPPTKSSPSQQTTPRISSPLSSLSKAIQSPFNSPRKSPLPSPTQSSPGNNKINTSWHRPEEDDDDSRWLPLSTTNSASRNSHSFDGRSSPASKEGSPDHPIIVVDDYDDDGILASRSPIQQQLYSSPPRRSTTASPSTNSSLPVSPLATQTGAVYENHTTNNSNNNNKKKGHGNEEPYYNSTAAIMSILMKEKERKARSSPRKSPTTSRTTQHSKDSSLSSDEVYSLLTKEIEKATAYTRAPIKFPPPPIIDFNNTTTIRRTDEVVLDDEVVDYKNDHSNDEYDEMRISVSKHDRTASASSVMAVARETSDGTEEENWSIRPVPTDEEVDNEDDDENDDDNNNDDDVDDDMEDDVQSLVASALNAIERATNMTQDHMLEKSELLASALNAIETAAAITTPIPQNEDEHHYAPDSLSPSKHKEKGTKQLDTATKLLEADGSIKATNTGNEEKAAAKNDSIVLPTFAASDQGIINPLSLSVDTSQLHPDYNKGDDDTPRPMQSAIKMPKNQISSDEAVSSTQNNEKQKSMPSPTSMTPAIPDPLQRARKTLLLSDLNRSTRGKSSTQQEVVIETVADGRQINEGMNNFRDEPLQEEHRTQPVETTEYIHSDVFILPDVDETYRNKLDDAQIDDVLNGGNDFNIMANEATHKDLDAIKKELLALGNHDVANDMGATKKLIFTEMATRVKSIYTGNFHCVDSIGSPPVADAKPLSSPGPSEKECAGRKLHAELNAKVLSMYTKHHYVVESPSSSEEIDKKDSKEQEDQMVADSQIGEEEIEQEGSASSSGESGEVDPLEELFEIVDESDTSEKSEEEEEAEEDSKYHYGLHEDGHDTVNRDNDRPIASSGDDKDTSGELQMNEVPTGSVGITSLHGNDVANPKHDVPEGQQTGQEILHDDSELVDSERALTIISEQAIHSMKSMDHSEHEPQLSSISISSTGDEKMADMTGMIEETGTLSVSQVTTDFGRNEKPISQSPIEVADTGLNSENVDNRVYSEVQVDAMQSQSAVKNAAVVLAAKVGTTEQIQSSSGKGKKWKERLANKKAIKNGNRPHLVEGRVPGSSFGGPGAVDFENLDDEQIEDVIMTYSDIKVIQGLPLDKGKKWKDRLAKKRDRKSDASSHNETPSNGILTLSPPSTTNVRDASIGTTSNVTLPTEEHLLMSPSNVGGKARDQMSPQTGSSSKSRKWKERIARRRSSMTSPTDTSSFPESSPKIADVNKGAHSAIPSKETTANEENVAIPSVQDGQVSLDTGAVTRSEDSVAATLPVEMLEETKKTIAIQGDLLKSFNAFDALLSGRPSIPEDDESIWTEVTVGQEPLTSTASADDEEQSYMEFTVDDSVQPSYFDETIASETCTRIGEDKLLKEQMISPFMSNLLSSRMFQDLAPNSNILQSNNLHAHIEKSSKQFPTIHVNDAADDDMTQITMDHSFHDEDGEEGDDYDDDDDVPHGNAQTILVDQRTEEKAAVATPVDSNPTVSGGRPPISKTSSHRSKHSLKSRRSTLSETSSSSLLSSESSKQRISEILRKDIWSRDISAVQAGMEELSKQARNGRKYRAHIVRCGGVMAITRTMEMNADDDVVQAPCCETLESLAKEPDTQAAICEMAGISLVVRSMQDHADNVKVQEAACAALASICRRQEVDNPQDPTKEADGAVFTLLTSMTRYSDNPRIQAKAFAAISNLCMESRERLSELSEAGGIMTLTLALQKPWENKQEQHEAISSLSILLRGITELNAGPISPNQEFHSFSEDGDIGDDYSSLATESDQSNLSENEAGFSNEAPMESIKSPAMDLEGTSRTSDASDSVPINGESIDIVRDGTLDRKQEDGVIIADPTVNSELSQPVEQKELPDLPTCNSLEDIPSLSTRSTQDEEDPREREKEEDGSTAGPDPEERCIIQ